MAADLPPVRKATWPDLVEEGFRAVFAAQDAEYLLDLQASDHEDDGGMGALQHRLRARYDETGETPAEVLRQLTMRDLSFVMHAGAPAAFLANRVANLPMPKTPRTSDDVGSDTK